MGLDLGAPYNGPAGEYELDEAFHQGSDTPGIGVLGVAVSDWAKIDYEFATALMYRPPGSSSVWAPLQPPKARFAKGTATNAPRWALTGAGQGLKPSQVPFKYFFKWTRGVAPPLQWVPPWP